MPWKPPPFGVGSSHDQLLLFERGESAVECSRSQLDGTLTHLIHFLHHGIAVQGASFDLAKMLARKDAIVAKMTRGIDFLFRKNKVDYFVGRGMVTVPGMVEITEGERKGQFLRTRNVLLATGCKPRRLPDVPVDGVRVMTSREALEPRAAAPRSIVIMGAGAIGVEFMHIQDPEQKSWIQRRIEGAFMDLFERAYRKWGGEQ